jgi:hypothetical protein
LSETKLKGTLPKDDEANGLHGTEWANRIWDEQNEHVAIITFTGANKNIDRSSGKATVVAQITRIEPVADQAEAEVLLNKLFDLAAERTGQTQLDLPKSKGAAVLDLNAGLNDFDGDDGDDAA